MTSSEPRYEPPGHLSEVAAGWWQRTLTEYPQLNEHGRLLLTGACEAWDRSREAAVILDREGVTLTDRFGQQKIHPAVAVERDSRAQFAKLLTDLELGESGVAVVSELDKIRQRYQERRRLARIEWENSQPGQINGTQ